MTESASIPPGGVIAYLSVAARGGQAAVDFYSRAFGAKEQFRQLAEDGERILHSRLKINGGLIMLSDEFPEYGQAIGERPTGVALHLQVDDPDEWWARALIAGAEPVMPLAEQFWGDRYGQLRDPFGHLWSIGGAKR